MDFPLSPDEYPLAELRKARRRHLVRQSVLLQQPLTGPMEVGVIPTYRCNFGCVFCSLPNEGRAGVRDVPTALWTKIIDELAEAECDQVSFTGGGEPLLHAELPAMVELTRARNMACSVCTNGSLLTPELATRWAELGVHLSVSFNAATEESYYAIHRGAKDGDFQRILNTLRYYVQTAAQASVCASFVSMNFVVNSVNYREIEAMVGLADLVGASQVQFRRIQPRDKHRHLLLDEAQLEEVRTTIRRLEHDVAAESNFTMQVAQSLRAECSGQMTDGVLQPGVVPEAFLDDRTWVPCIEGYIASYVDADGTVFPCCLRSTSITGHYMGNLGEQSFAEIWRGDAYTNFRREAANLDPASFRPGEDSCAYCPKAKHFLYLVDEFTPGNYLDLTRRRADSLGEENNSLRERIGRFAPLPDLAMRAGFAGHHLPEVLPPGKEYKLSVIVRNAGPFIWPGYDVAGDHGVGLGYHLLDKRGRMLRFDNNPRAYLPRDLSPDETVELELSIHVPAEEGRYLIELDMVQERIGWFADAGGQTLRLPLRVEA
ncbi:MAG TPA: radical SAM protein [bacterium]|nr:radical SAM protein [bacterium]